MPFVLFRMFLLRQKQISVKSSLHPCAWSLTRSDDRNWFKTEFNNLTNSLFSSRTAYWESLSLGEILPSSLLSLPEMGYSIIRYLNLAIRLLHLSTYQYGRLSSVRDSLPSFLCHLFPWLKIHWSQNDDRDSKRQNLRSETALKIGSPGKGYICSSAPSAAWIPFWTLFIISCNQSLRSHQQTTFKPWLWTCHLFPFLHMASWRRKIRHSLGWTYL